MMHKNRTRILLIMLIIITPIAFYFRSELMNQIGGSDDESIELASLVDDQSEAQIASLEGHKKLIFNLHGILIKEDLGRIVKKIGFSKLASFAMSNWKNPVDSCLDILEKMAVEQKTKKSHCLIYQGRELPHCITEWQLGEQTYAQVDNAISQYIENLDGQNYFASKDEKEITQEIIAMAFNPQQITEISKPVNTMISLVQQLKKSGYQLYVIADMPHEVQTAVEKTYPDLVKLFDGITISAEAKALKSDEKLFKYLLSKYDLDPEQCIVIDDQDSSTTIAQNLGMQSITFTNAKALKSSLKKIGVL